MSNWTAIVTCLALLLYAALLGRVGAARVKYNILAPATTGHPAFERAFRIHANTGEQLLIFLPSLWLFATYVSSLWAGLFGLVWIGARIFYAVSYSRDPQKRTLGFVIGFLATAILLLGSLLAIAWQAIHGGA
jgi:glutathione S-transferase